MKTCQLSVEEIIEFIKKQKVAIIASIDDDGNTKVRAMIKPRKMIGNCIYYFSVRSSWRRVKHFRQNPNASIYFYRRDAFTCSSVMFKGKMEILQDPELKKELWKPFDRIRYRKGVTDPHYCVLKFTATEGKWYNEMRKGGLIVY